MSLLRGIETIEVCNFKSYHGLTTVGPFKEFTAIVGPNGSGKSNIIDAIIFGLGITSNKVRADRLRDLINNITVQNDKQPTAYVELNFTPSPGHVIKARRTLVLTKHYSKGSHDKKSKMGDADDDNNDDNNNDQDTNTTTSTTTSDTITKYSIRTLWSINGTNMDKGTYLSTLSKLGLGYSNPNFVYNGSANEHTNDTQLSETVDELVTHVNTYNTAINTIRLNQTKRRQEMFGNQEDDHNNNNNNPSPSNSTSSQSSTNPSFPSLSLTTIQDLYLPSTLDPLNKHDLPPFILPQSHVALFSQITPTDLFKVINSTAGNTALSSILTQVQTLQGTIHDDINRFQALKNRHENDHQFLKKQKENFQNFLEKKDEFSALLQEYYLFTLLTLDLSLYHSIAETTVVENNQRSLGGEYDAICMTLTSLETTLLEKRKEINTTQRKLRDLQNTLSTPQDTLMKLGEVAKKNDIKVDNVEKEIDNLKDRLDFEQSNLDVLQHDLTTAKNQYKVFIGVDNNDNDDDNNNNNDNKKKMNKNNVNDDTTSPKNPYSFVTQDQMDEYRQLCALFDMKWNRYCFEQSGKDDTTTNNKNNKKGKATQQKVANKLPLNQLHTTQSHVEQSLVSMGNMTTSITQSKGELGLKISNLVNKLTFAQQQKDTLTASLIEKQTKLNQIKIQISNYDINRDKDYQELMIMGHKVKLGLEIQRQNKNSSKYVDIVKELQSFLSTTAVHGLAQDLIKVKNDRYQVALGAALGRYNNAIVVDTTQTALSCVAYLHEQKLSPCTFLSLEYLNEQLGIGMKKVGLGRVGTSSTSQNAKQHQRKVLNIKRFITALHSDHGLVLYPNGQNALSMGVTNIRGNNNQGENNSTIQNDDNDDDELVDEADEIGTAADISSDDEQEMDDDDSDEDDGMKRKKDTKKLTSRSVVPTPTSHYSTKTNKSTKVNSSIIKTKTARRLIDIITPSPTYNNLVLYLLGNIVIDTDINAISQYAFNDGFIGIKYVSYIGDVIHSSKYITYVNNPAKKSKGDDDDDDDQDDDQKKKRNKKGKKITMGDDDLDDIDQDDDNDQDTNRRKKTSHKNDNNKKSTRITNLLNNAKKNNDNDQSKFNFDEFVLELASLSTLKLSQKVDQMVAMLSQLKAKFEQEYGSVADPLTTTISSMMSGGHIQLNNANSGNSNHKSAFLDRKRDQFTHTHFDVLNDTNTLRSLQHDIDLYNTQLTSLHRDNANYEQQLGKIEGEMKEKNELLGKIKEQLSEYQEIREQLQTEILAKFFSSLGKVTVPKDFYLSTSSSLINKDDGDDDDDSSGSSSSGATRGAKGKNTKATPNKNNKKKATTTASTQSTEMIEVEITSIETFDRFIIQMDKLWADKVMSLKTAISHIQAQIAYSETQINTLNKTLSEKNKVYETLKIELKKALDLQAQIEATVINLKNEYQTLSDKLLLTEDEFNNVLQPKKIKISTRKREVEVEMVNLDKKLRLLINEILSWQRRRSDIVFDATSENVILPKVDMWNSNNSHNNKYEIPIGVKMNQFLLSDNKDHNVSTRRSKGKKDNVNRFISRQEFKKMIKSNLGVNSPLIDDDDGDDDDQNDDDIDIRSTGKKTTTRGAKNTIKRSKQSKQDSNDDELNQGRRRTRNSTTSMNDNDDSEDDSDDEGDKKNNKDEPQIILTDYLFYPMSLLTLLNDQASSYLGPSPSNSPNQNKTAEVSPKQGNKKDQKSTSPPSFSPSQRSQSQNSQSFSQLSKMNDEERNTFLSNALLRSLPCLDLNALIASSPTATALLCSSNQNAMSNNDLGSYGHNNNNNNNNNSLLRLPIFDYTNLAQDLRSHFFKNEFYSFFSQSQTIMFPFTFNQVQNYQYRNDMIKFNNEEDNDDVSSSSSSLSSKKRSSRTSKQKQPSPPIQLSDDKIDDIYDKLTELYALGIERFSNPGDTDKKQKTALALYKDSITDQRVELDNLSMTTAYASLSGAIGNDLDEIDEDVGDGSDDDDDDDDNDGMKSNTKKGKNKKNNKKNSINNNLTKLSLFQLLTHSINTANTASIRFNQFLDQIGHDLELELSRRFYSVFGIIRNTAQSAYKTLTQFKGRLELTPINIMMVNSSDDDSNINNKRKNEKTNMKNKNLNLNNSLIGSHFNQSDSLQFEQNFNLSNLSSDANNTGIGSTMGSFSSSPPQILLQASPPDKQLTTASMLSGGERGLVSVCVLLGLLQAIGCGVAILDEVDANLDPFMVNNLSHFIKDQVGKFTNYQRRKGLIPDDDNNDDDDGDDHDVKNTKGNVNMKKNEKDNKEKKMKFANRFSQTQTQTQDSSSNNNSSDEFSQFSNQKNNNADDDEQTSGSILELYQCLCISLKNDMYSNADALIGVSAKDMKTQIYSLDLTPFG